MSHIHVSEETLEILDVLAKLILDLYDRYEQGLEFLLIRDIPSELLKEFKEKIVNPSYQGGCNEAIQDLMWKAVQEQKEKKQLPDC